MVVPCFVSLGSISVLILERKLLLQLFKLSPLLLFLLFLVYFTSYRMIDCRNLLQKILSCIIEIFNGIISDIPLCCVLDFVKKHWAGLQPAAQMRHYVESVDDQDYLDSHIGYSMCERCFRRRRKIKVRDCPIIAIPFRGCYEDEV